ncbi:hypothetical protein ES702_04952 [subsurface metagenome]
MNIKIKDDNIIINSKDRVVCIPLLEDSCKNIKEKDIEQAIADFVCKKMKKE